MPPKALSWKDRPALIETLLPVQKLSVESYKEQMAGSGKTLTALGSYWKGRKPLILNKACVLGCLLPTSDDPLKDLEIFELLMAMDEESLAKRLQAKNDQRSRFFLTEDSELVVDQGASYAEWVKAASRPEECDDLTLYAHVWDRVNQHLGTTAHSFPELVEQMGIARFGYRPKVGDVFCGSGQIPFEAARLGCDVYASDLNPIACMLTWGAFHIVGADEKKREFLQQKYEQLSKEIETELQSLKIEEDGGGWRIKALLYCVEVKCPETGWVVPLIPSLYINKHRRIIAILEPDPLHKKYNIKICIASSEAEFQRAKYGTLQNGEMVHSPDGKMTHRTRISSLRGDYREAGESKNRLRSWEKSDFIPRLDDIFQERLYCVQWVKRKKNSKKFQYQFRTVTQDDLDREQKVIDYVQKNFSDWQEKGYIPDMQIEPGNETTRLSRERGWTYWHHLFNSRQLLLLKAINQKICKVPEFTVMFPAILNLQSKLCAWHNDGRKGGCQNAFSNQALNTLWNYGTRGLADIVNYIYKETKEFKIPYTYEVQNHSASSLDCSSDIFITDPPYGDAVNYEEITEFFIAWLRKNPPKEFAHWTWDSRRALAIKGDGQDFRQGMIDAYRRMGELMPDHGIQILMFTHQSGSIWADMANIIWAAGLRVTAAWYVVTETDSALRQGANVTGTVLLVLRKCLGENQAFRDDLGWEIAEAVETQIEALTGLDQRVRENRSEGLYTDADLQMAGYAAALKVLTSYSHIDGKDMVVEAQAPKLEGRENFVEELIDFAVQTAVQFLVPLGMDKADWQRLAPIERFYLKMAELEAMGENTLDNYQNFAKAFKVRDFQILISDNSRANNTRLKLSADLGRSHLSGDGELVNTPLRAVLYAIHEFGRDIESDTALAHLSEIYPAYHNDRNLLATLADFLATKRAVLPDKGNYKPQSEASQARILAEAIRSQKL